jgi:hypothetical protein
MNRTESTDSPASEAGLTEAHAAEAGEGSRPAPVQEPDPVGR